jgi:Outer membrane protein beta-barrel domain
MRRPLMPALFAVALLTPLPALADEPNCPPGSWFCADPNVDTPPQAPADEDSAPQLPSARPPAAAEDAPEIDQDRAPTRRPRVVVVEEDGGYATPPPNVVIVTQQHKPRVVRRAPSYATPAPPPRRQPKLYSKWGFNLRIQGAAMGDGANVDAGIGGVGLGLRYRPVPAFGFDLGLDIIGGKDFNGFTRIETPVSLNAMIFVNPRSRVQFYLIGGAHLSQAQVRSDVQHPLLDRREDGTWGAEYSYFGGQGGAGLEFRLGRRVGLSFDALAFLRKRTDDNPKPEYVEVETGRTTNTSAGVLFRGGLNFWW